MERGYIMPAAVLGVSLCSGRGVDDGQLQVRGSLVQVPGVVCPQIAKLETTLETTSNFRTCNFFPIRDHETPSPHVTGTANV